MSPVNVLSYFHSTKKNKNKKNTEKYTEATLINVYISVGNWEEHQEHTSKMDQIRLTFSCTHLH